MSSVKEINVVVKRPRPNTLRILILIPTPYRAAMSSLFLHMAYSYLNNYEHIYAERAWVEGNYYIVSAETSTPLRKFDVVLFSLSYELDYVSFVKILIESGLNPFSKSRGLSDPLIVVGGLAPTSNPEPIAELADVIVIGDAENFLQKIVEIGKEEKKHIIDYLDGIEGIYIPKFQKERIKKSTTLDLNTAFHPVAEIIPKNVEPIFGRGYLIEATRGCPHLCSFCLEGHVNLPFRWRSLKILRKLIRKGVKVCEVNKVILYSLSLFDHPQANDILQYLVNEGLEASIPSIRPSTLTDERIELIARLGQRTLTIAPETGSKDLACMLRKPLNYDVARLVKKAITTGIKHIKLYIMTALPGEKESDLKETIDLIKKIIVSLPKRYPEILRVSLNPLVPKPHTPFQWLPPTPVNEARQKIEFIRKSIKSPYIRIQTYDPRWAWIQGIIALGTRDLGRILVEVAERNSGLGAWRASLSRFIDRFKYIKYGWDIDSELPWDFIDVGIPKNYLVQEYLMFKTYDNLEV